MKRSKSSKTIATQADKLDADAEQLRRQAEKKEGDAIRLRSPTACRRAIQDISRRKGNVAVFLGAGASKTFGWPLTRELLPQILRGIVDHTLFEDVRINNKRQNASDRRRLAEALEALCPGIKLTNTYLTTNNHRLPLVTSLLSMLDYSLSSGQALVSGLSTDEIKNARVLLERAIYETIEHGEIEVSPNYWPPREPNEYTLRLVKWLDAIRSEPAVGIVTSNYDVAIERAWRFALDDMKLVDRLSIDFGFDWTWPSNSYPEKLIQRPVSPKRRLYKLHGSTNWLRCGLCDRVYINPEVDIAVYAYAREETANNGCHCGHSKLEVQIVSPSFVRDVRAPNLITVWQNALNWLRKAEDWIIVGYSFPDEDLNIRSLFTRALASREDPPFVTAIQVGANPETRTRYEAFFPSGQMTFLNGGLEAFLDNIKKR